MRARNRLDIDGVAKPTFLLGMNPNDGQPYYIAVNKLGQIQVDSSATTLGVIPEATPTAPANYIPTAKKVFEIKFWKFSCCFYYG